MAKHELQITYERVAPFVSEAAVSCDIYKLINFETL